jgi:hypothetical protein
MQSNVHQTGNDEIAFIVLMRICRDYANPYAYPLMTGEVRDKWLIEKLQRFRIKYFEKV